MAKSFPLALQVQMPEFTTPQEFEAQRLGQERARYANELAKMQAQENRRSLQEQEQVRNYLSGGANLTAPETVKGLYGFGKTGAEMAQRVMAAKKEEREAAKSQEDLMSKIQSRYLNQIGSAHSFKEIANIYQGMFNDPLVGPMLKQSGRDVNVGLKAIEQAQNSPDPTTAFRDLQLRMASGVQKYLEMSKPTVMQQGNRLVSVEPISGRVGVVPGSEYEQPITPYQKEQMVLQRELAGQGVSYQTDAQGNIIALPTRVTPGVPPVAKPVTGEGGGPIKAKPTAFAEKAEAQRKQMSRDITLAITEIEDAIKPGGLLEKSTASGLGKMLDERAAYFGISTEGARSAAALKPIADLGLKMVPRFEGPQSDKDTQSYKEAAGQLANEALPIETRRSAAKVLVKLMKARQGQFVNQAMANEGIAPAVEVSAPAAAPTNRPSLNDIFGGK